MIKVLLLALLSLSFIPQPSGERLATTVDRLDEAEIGQVRGRCPLQTYEYVVRVDRLPAPLLPAVPTLGQDLKGVLTLTTSHPAALLLQGWLDAGAARQGQLLGSFGLAFRIAAQDQQLVLTVDPVLVAQLL
jgi:hypothetical protein